ncbi:sodium:calcium antiporter [Haloarchaeobius salinus]|uniref:sodium:calcium antiporter n=1 Tax=Haloarchaeobius salinus TaxID=1198298 RepID=UPI00210D39ED|nr:sodium:calcium antiporter [Haloarchaeobius salinus]
MAGTLVQLGIVVAAVVGLGLGARLLVDSAVRLARGVGLSQLTIGLTVVAAGTSMPELAVTVDAALEGLGDLAVGNVFGSNIYNLAFVLGVVALIRVVPVEGGLVRRDGLMLLASTLLGGFVVLDQLVTRTEGAVLVVVFVAYTGYLLHSRTDESPPEPDAAVVRDITGRLTFPGRDPLLLVVGLVVVLVSGDALVGAASALARGAGVSEWVIGGTIVAAGTSTPEFAVSLVALRRGSLGVSIGNVVGSNVFNVLAVLGVGALVRPLSVSPVALETFGWLLAVTAVMVAALWTGRVLSRLEGAVFTASELARWALGLLG